MNIGIFTDTYFPQVSGVATSIQTLKNDLERKVTLYIFLQRLILTYPRIRLSLIFFVWPVYLLSHSPIEELLSAECFMLLI